LNVTNNTNLPLPVYRAIVNDPYDAGDSDISVTRLISPPRKVALEKLHADEITEDAADRIFSLFGQIPHAIVERAAVEGYLAEGRVSAEVLGWKVSGAFDIYDEERACIIDLKFVSVWEVVNGVKEERHQQLNMLAELMRRNGFPVKSLEVIFMFRDWSKLAADRDADYPQKQVLTFPIPLWGEVKAAVFLTDKVLDHQAAQSGNLPECSDEERWAKAPKFAVKKETNKRAERLLDTYEEAWAYAKSKGYTVSAAFGTVFEEAMKKGYIIEERPGANTRCESYCNAAPFCDQWRAIQSLTGAEVAE
jgi:hypothetical protein